MRKLVMIAALAVAGVVQAQCAHAADVFGRATVVDGDTIAVEGAPARIRLDGIDAPEGKQTCTDANGATYLCGPRAANALAAIIGRNGRVTCTPTGTDRYRRQVATCVIGGVDINQEMVRQGWALDFARYSGGRYAKAEAEAREAKRGLWAGGFQAPWDWRAARQSRTPAVPLRAMQLAEAETTATSCKTAKTCRDAVILWCNGYGRADADDDGIPCENVCRTLKQVEPIKKEIGCEL